MATLEKIRSKAGLLVTVIGIALFAFIIGDFLRSGSTFVRLSKENIAIVNGESIGIQDFHKELELALNNYKASQGGSITEEQQNQVRQMVFDEMVSSILLKEKSDKIGLVVNKEELSDLIMGNNISPIIRQYFQDPQTGVFDKNRLIQFVQVIESDDWSMYAPEAQQQLYKEKQTWTVLKRTIAEQKLQEKFAFLLNSAIVANSLDAKATFDENNVSVDFDIITQSFNTIPDEEIEVSDAEIANLYKLRKNNFKQEHSKVINYIAVNILPNEADFNEVSGRMEKLRNELSTSAFLADLVNENSDEQYLDAFVSEAQLGFEEKKFIENASVGDINGPTLTDGVFNVFKLLGIKQAPDSVRVNQIAFPLADEESLNARIDSLMKLIRSGKPFSEVALAESNGQTNGDLGWQTEASLVRGVDAKFANALFEAKVNDLITVKSAYGLHFVQIVEKTNPVKKYKIAAIKSRVTPSQETYNKLYSNLNQFISKNRNLEDFKSAATDAGYYVQTNVEIFENQNNIASIESTRPVIKWAFSSKKGEISEIFETQNRDFFIVAAVEGERKAGFRALSEVSDILKRELINEKKGAKIVERLKLKNLETIGDYAMAMNASVQEVKFVTFATQRISLVGSEPIVNAKALAAEVGQVTEPFAGKNGVYVLVVTAKNTNSQPFILEQQKQQMNMQNSYKIMQLLQNNRLLKDKAIIEDNRSRFY